MPRITLPKYYDTEDVKLVVRQCEEEHFQEIFNMFQNSMTDSTGW